LSSSIFPAPTTTAASGLSTTFTGSLRLLTKDDDRGLRSSTLTAAQRDAAIEDVGGELRRGSCYRRFRDRQPPRQAQPPSACDHFPRRAVTPVSSEECCTGTMFSEDKCAVLDRLRVTYRTGTGRSNSGLKNRLQGPPR
jgi:hypothetical protein